MAHRLSYSKACRIVPDQKSNSCLLHWQADSLPLCHQRSPLLIFLIVLVRKVKVSQSCPTLCEYNNPMGYTWNSPGQNNWPFPSPGDLPNPGIESRSLTSQVDSLPAEPQGKPKNTGVGSLSLLQQIFLTQETNSVSCIAGRFFTN